MGQTYERGTDRKGLAKIGVGVEVREGGALGHDGIEGA